MKLYQIFFSFLNKPFPGVRPVKKLILSNIFVGTFIALFLIVFQPFQINEWETNNKVLKLAGYGVVSFIIPICVTFLIRLILPRKITEDNWKARHEILSIVVVLIFIALGNLLYSNFLSTMSFSLKGLVSAFSYTVLIGIFPVTIHVMLKHNKLLKINTAQASIINNQLGNKGNEAPVISITEKENEVKIESIKEDEEKAKIKLTFLAENEKDKIELEPSHLYYIESADNYSNIFYTENGLIKKQMIRSSLKRLESQHSIDHIIRCHRTFIVNLKNVKKVEGNAAGYKLSFAQDNYSVAVSRNYGVSVIEKLKSLRN